MIGKKLLAKILTLFLAVGCVSCNSLSAATSGSDSSASNFSKDFIDVDLCDPIIRAYLNAETEEEQFSAYLQIKNSSLSLDKQNVIISWEENAIGFGEKYILSIASNQDYKNAYVVETTDTCYEGGVLLPGKTYYYKVENESGKLYQQGKIKTKNLPGRFLDIEGTYNFRDLGGWKTEDDSVINSGLVYRCGRMTLNHFGKEQMSYLGVKTEIDLRGVDDDYGQTSCQFDGTYIKTPIASYMFCIPSSNYYVKSYVEEPFQKIFEVMSNEDNYPLVFHCNAGADRTGFLAFILNGLCGVSYQDLTRDFELTTASIVSGPRCRAKIGESGFDYTLTEEDIRVATSACWTLVYNTIMEDYGEADNKLSTAIKNYLLDIGVEEYQIEQVKEILID